MVFFQAKIDARKLILFQLHKYFPISTEMKMKKSNLLFNKYTIVYTIVIILYNQKKKL